MRVADSGLRFSFPLIAASVFVGCATVIGDFTTHPDDAGAHDTGTDSSMGGTGDSSDDGAGEDASGGMDSASHGDTGGAKGDAAPDGAGCSKTTCGTSCVDTQTDPANCGTCGNDCATLPHVATATGVTCSAGVCSVPVSACQAGYAHCGGNPQQGCETSLSSAQSCGSCTTMCSGNTSLCQLDTSTMTYACASSCSGTTPDLCGATCTNTQNDPQHCGGCSNACPTVTGGGVATCNGGQCGVQCQTGEHQCGTTAMCALDTDIDNCGPACVPCTAPGGGSVACVSGACQPSCPSGDQTCNAVCTDTATDPANCGGCGMDCSAPKSACSNGSCACPTATPTYCSATQTCADTGTDSANCGACGHSCLGGACSGGVCQPVTEYTPKGIVPVGGLYGMVTTGFSPENLLLTNCASGGDPTLEITPGSPPTNVFGGTSGNSYCGGTIYFESLNVYYATSNGTTTNGALWYTTWFNSAWGTPTEMDNGTIAANIVAIQANTGDVDFTTNAATNYICDMPTGSKGVAPSCASLVSSLSSYGTKGVHGMGTDSAGNIYVACTAGAIVEMPSDNLIAQSLWLASGVGVPYDVHYDGTSYMYWSDHANGAIYRSPLTTPAAANLTSGLPSGRIPAAEVPDGFMVDTSANVVYFWNRTSGNIWKIANNGTSTAMTNVAANPSGIGAVAQDAAAIYWSVETSPPAVMMLAK